MTSRSIKPNKGSIKPKMGIIEPDMGSTASASTMPGPAPQRLSLASALFSGTQQRVLGLLFGQPGRNFYSNELIALTGSGSGAVQRELSRLVQSELVTCQLVGRQKHYQANPRSPIFDELCGIARKTIALAEPMKEALAPLASRILAAFVYGSVAKRQDTASSDVDLMLVSDDLNYPDLYRALESLEVQLGRKVNPTVYTRRELAQRIQRRDAFVQRVLEQPKVWLIGGADALGL